MPRRPRRTLARPAELADWTELQHWAPPALHSLIVVAVGVAVTVIVVVPPPPRFTTGDGVAAARRGRTARAAARVNFIVSMKKNEMG